MIQSNEPLQGFNENNKPSSIVSLASFYFHFFQKREKMALLGSSGTVFTTLIFLGKL
jgi:hypothetical protein